MDGVTAGRIVHYVPFPGDELNVVPGEHIPAMIVRDFGGGCVNLMLIPDGTNQAPGRTPGIGIWTTSVQFDPTGETPRSWHWIERA